MSPLTHQLAGLSQWIWRETLTVAELLYRTWVFQPLHWPPAASGLYVLSRNLAWTASGAVFVWGVLRSMWPELSPGGGLSPLLVVNRAVVAAFIGGAALWAVEALLAVNNAIVAQFGSPVPPVLTDPSRTVAAMTPLISIAFGGFILSLLIYLVFFYALRAVEIFLLTALIPWLAVWWIHSVDDTMLRNAGQELLVAIFVQSAQAGAFWLFAHLLAGGRQTLTTVLEDAGVLWYMTQLPNQLRRIAGGGISPVRLPRPWK